MNLFQCLFMIGTLVLLLAAWVRCRRTPVVDPERQARADMVRLLGIALAGEVLLLVRERYRLGTPGFYGWSVALLPVVLLTLYYVWRLVGAYRRSR